MYAMAESVDAGCCIRFMSFPTATVFHLANKNAGFAVFRSECKLQRICIPLSLWPGSDSYCKWAAN